jgi:hypothetical protein
MKSIAVSREKRLRSRRCMRDRRKSWVMCS